MWARNYTVGQHFDTLVIICMNEKRRRGGAVCEKADVSHIAREHLSYLAPGYGLGSVICVQFDMSRRCDESIKAGVFSQCVLTC